MTFTFDVSSINLHDLRLKDSDVRFSMTYPYTLSCKRSVFKMAGEGIAAAETFRKMTRMGSITSYDIEVQEKFNSVLDR